jgi:hypothetical protein
MMDDLTRRLAEQILRGGKELYEEQNLSELLSPGIPIAPHAAAERIGISPVGLGSEGWGSCTASGGGPSWRSPPEESPQEMASR